MEVANAQPVPVVEKKDWVKMANWLIVGIVKVEVNVPFVMGKGGDIEAHQSFIIEKFL